MPELRVAKNAIIIIALVTSTRIRAFRVVFEIDLVEKDVRGASKGLRELNVTGAGLKHKISTIRKQITRSHIGVLKERALCEKSVLVSVDP